MKKIYYQTTIGLLLIIIGCIAWQLRLSNEFVQSEPSLPTSIKSASAPKDSTVSGQPSQLTIPSLNMTIPIIPGIYSPKSNTWTLSLDKVQYAVITTPPNNVSGNTFLYGHYRPEVFARLHLIQLGASAQVDTVNGHQFTYQLENEKVTAPSDLSIFSYNGPPILTIQTCTGLFFQNRQFFTFKLVGVA